MGNKHLILGGYGFLGQHIVKQLLEEGCEVRVLANSSQPTYWAFPGEHLKDVEVINGDYRDVDTTTVALKGVSCVYHFISTTTPASSVVDPIFDVQSNLLATLQLLQAAVREGVEQVVFPSSGGTVYGLLSQVPVPETHPTNPILPYGIVKLATEKYLHLFHHIHGLKYTILRIANPYGPGQNPISEQGVINVLLWRLARNEPIEIWGDGEVVRDYIYVEDVARATLMAAKNEHPAKLFNVGSGSGVSINNLLSVIFEVTGCDVPVSYGSSRAFDVPISVMSIQKIQKEIGWRPRTSLVEGIGKTWEWIQRL